MFQDGGTWERVSSNVLSEYILNILEAVGTGLFCMINKGLLYNTNNQARGAGPKEALMTTTTACMVTSSVVLVKSLR